ncbi:hypothetical protein [Endozoicomonas sp. GU-1]|uniref:hypothetical protein n=1 Tax=Endozoicomonas sp. GU-1 TaxID=3009078 RepID=UPI0022B4227B|nr:hypothetical protein [Endozoicomonas sp. GU-1]WBA85376.1 hypothetical protein O3276_19325 [Endozoicomonas sp. GU-1]
MYLHGSAAAPCRGDQRTASSERAETSGVRAGRDVRAHADPPGLPASYAPPGTEPLQRSVSEYNLAIVRDGVRGCVETGKKASPEFFIYLEKIKPLLDGPPTEESLKEIGELYKLINECDFFTEEMKTLDYVKKRISFQFSYYVEQQKKALVDQLKTCFSIRSRGGADSFYEQFTGNIKRLFCEFTPVMQDLLHNVGLTILSSELDQGVMSHLTDQLCKNVSPEHLVSRQSTAVLAELEECAHTAELIVRRQGKHKPAVMQHYIDRLSALIGRSASMSASDRGLHLQTLELINSVVTDTMAISPGSDAENYWHRMLFEAVLNVRFSSEFMTAYQHLLSPLPPQQWGLEELEGFVTLLRISGQSLGYCSQEFVSLLAKMDGTDNGQPAATSAAPVSGCDDGDDCRAVEIDETPDKAGKGLTKEERKKELGKFLHVVALEASGEFYHSNYDKSYSDWHVITEILFGQRAFTSPHARKAIRILVDLSKGGGHDCQFAFFRYYWQQSKGAKKVRAGDEPIQGKATGQD